MTAAARRPPRWLPSAGALRVFEGQLVQYRNTWKGSLVSSIISPVLFLAAMGLSLGLLVDDAGRLGEGVSYLIFLAPGLLAATAMQSGANESSYQIMGSFKWNRRYEGVLATPVDSGNLVTGHLLFITFRLVVSLSVFLVVMAAFGAVTLPLGLLALPASILTGLAFAAPTAAFAARIENDSGFAALQRFVLVPMFLFSGTFFPVAQLPVVFEQIAYVTPLWHGVSLTRGLALGDLDPFLALVNVGYLGALLFVGVWLARRQFRKRLVV